MVCWSEARSGPEELTLAFNDGYVVDARLPPAHQAPLVGNVAALVPHKGQRHFIEAAALVIRQVPDARFVIAGEGDTIKKRYKIVRIGVNSAVVEDTEFKGGNQQTLPLEAELAG